ncbi:488_t:CDS:2, partial [Gigaspora margarita]
NNDGYNIHLLTAKDKLLKTLLKFPNIFDINLNMLKNDIIIDFKSNEFNLQSVGINYELSKYFTIIQNTLYTLKHNHDNDNSTNNIDDTKAQFDNDF